jgi:hypothetical protein
MRILLLMLLAGSAFAGPGAHGPGGEHLDGPAQVLSGGHGVPRAEAKSELFELVARVEGGTLSVLIDRYDTNEPILDAAVEVESGTLKAKAKFRREQGDYAVDDPALVKRLASPGTHPLVFTVSAGKDSDLLDASMHVAGEAGAPGRTSYATIAAWLVGGAIVPVGAAALFIRARRRKGEFR